MMKRRLGLVILVCAGMGGCATVANTSPNGRLGPAPELHDCSAAEDPATCECENGVLMSGMSQETAIKECVAS